MNSLVRSKSPSKLKLQLAAFSDQWPLIGLHNDQVGLLSVDYRSWWFGFLAIFDEMAKLTMGKMAKNDNSNKINFL